MRANKALTLAGLLGLGLGLPPPAFAASSALEIAPAWLGRDERAATEFFSSLRYFSASDWTAIAGIGGPWSTRFSPRSGRNVAVEFLHAEIGMARGAWRFSYLQRREIILEASRDTVDFLHTEKNNLPIPVGRRYALSLDANGLEGEALKVGRTFEVLRSDASSVRASLAASLIRGRRTRTSTVRGDLTATAPGVFAFDVNWSDSYTKKTYPFLTPGAPEGTGYAIDGAIAFDWGENNRLTLSVADLGARIDWRDVPSTDARATSNTGTRDAQGFIVYRPAVAGQNRRKAFSQRLDPKTTIEYSRALDAFSVGAGVLLVDGLVMPRVALGYRLDDAWRFALEREFRFGSLGVALQYKYLSLAVSIESSDPGKAKARGLAAQLVVPF